MPQALHQPSENLASPFRVRWTRAECERFVADGLLQPGRYELIDGEILRKMGQKPPHATTVMQLIAWCLSIFGADFVMTQATIDVSPEDTPTSEPEPDVFVLRRSVAQFQVDYPGPSDLFLVAEVSDTTLGFDLSTKASLYSRAGIVEYWVIDVVGRGLIAHRDPVGDRYQSVLRYGADESLAPLCRPDAVVAVANLLPPVVP